MVFNEQNVSIFKKIRDTDGVDPCTDTALLHSRGILFYATIQFTPYEFNVDTREDWRMVIEPKPLFPSLVGICREVVVVFGIF